MVQQLKVEACFTHQKQEELIQKLQEEIMESMKRHSFQEFQEAEQESEQQQRALIASEKLVLRHELQEAEQEQQQHAWIRTAETKLLQEAPIRLEADSMVQAKPSMCSASTTIRTNDLQSERPATTPSLSDVELDEAQQDAQELRTHMHVNAADMLSTADHVVTHETASDCE